MVAFMAVAAFAGLNSWRAAGDPSYTITFQTTGTGSDASQAITTVEDIIADGATYVSEISNAVKVYKGRDGRGIKLGTASVNGEITLKLANAVKPSKIVVKARKYNDTSNAITINGQEFEINDGTSDDCVLNYDGNTEVSEIAIVANKFRAYVISIAVYEASSEAPAEDVYVVAGSSTTLFGTAWNSSAEDNDANKMTKNTETGVYEKVYAGVALPAGNIEFKIVKNGSDWIPSGSGNNLICTISETATYDVTFTFDPATSAITSNAEKKGEAQLPDAEINKVEIRGGKQGDWASFSKNFELVKAEEGAAYTATIDLAEFAGPFDFKLVVNENVWIGTNMLTLVDEAGLVQVSETDGADFTLKNDAYQTYTVTATWQENEKAEDGWTVTIVGKDARVPAPVNIDLKLTEACDIAAKVAEAVEGKNVGDIKIELTQGVAYTFNSTVELPGSLTFYGNDAVIDASALEGPMFQMVALVEPTEWTKAKVDIAGIKVKGLKKALFFSNSKNYLFEQFDINWVNVELAGDATTFDFTKGSVAATLQVTNSTFYAPTATTKSFYSSQSGQKATEAPEVPTQIFKFFNNTMYNLATGKNFFSHRQSNQTWLAYEVAGNIFVNCGKSGQVIKGMNGGQGGANPTWQINGNAFNFDETDAETSELTRKDTSANEETGDAEEPVQESVAGIVTFTDAAAGDFNGTFDLAEGATRPQTLGAPMWTLTFNGGVPTVAEINKVEIRGGKQGDWASFSKNFELVKAEEGAAYTATIDLAEFAGPFDFKLVVNENVWIGTNMLTLVDEAGLVQVSETDGADFTLKNDAYQTYTVTATWQENEKAEDGWTVTIVGKDARVPAPVNIDLKLTEACDIAAKVAEAVEGKNVGDIKIELTQGVAYTFNSTVELPGSLTFYGNDAVIDASALEGPMFQMVALVEPTEWTKAKVDIAGIKVKGLKKALFFSNSKNYLFEQFDINWVNVELAGDATTFDFTKGSVAATLQVTNSTFYAPTATTKSFYSSQSGQKATEAPEVPTQIFKFFNNTMYNLATGKNFFSHRQSNQTWLAYEVAGNIFVNCGKSGQVIKGMNGGQGGANPTWQINGNAFNFDETDAETSELTRKDTSANEETGDAEEPVQESVAGIVTFTDAAAGDFNGTFDLAEGATRPQTLGAPMWTLTFNGGAPAVEDTYTVAGAFYNSDQPQALFLETAWDPTNVKNDLEKYTDTYYFKSYAGVEFPSAGNFQVKVVKNHDWNVASYPADNVTVAIAEAGKYDVSISFDTTTGEVRLIVDPQFVPAEPIYTVVGGYYTADGEINIFNGEKLWDEKNTNADMIIVEGDDFYSLQIDAQGIELQPGTITYKVVKNHDWTENWGMEDKKDGNAEYKINEAGKYNILFKFNPNAKFENGYNVDCVVTTTTGIQNVKADDLKNATIYNLQGVRMQNVQKGLYIVNGKKVVVK